MGGAYVTALGRATRPASRTWRPPWRAACPRALSRSLVGGRPPGGRDRTPEAGCGRDSGDLEGALHPRLRVRIALERVRALLEGHGGLLGAPGRHAGDHLSDPGAEDVEVVRVLLILDRDHIRPVRQGLDGLAALLERDREAGTDGAGERRGCGRGRHRRDCDGEGRGEGCGGGEKARALHGSPTVVFVTIPASWPGSGVPSLRAEPVARFAGG